MNLMKTKIFHPISLIFLLLLYQSCSNSHNKESSVSSMDNSDMSISDEIPWSERMAISVMHRHPEAWTTENDSIIKWNYKIGLLGKAFLDLYEVTGNEKYLNYFLDYSKLVIDPQGNILDYHPEDYNIDNINSGKILFLLYDETGDERYKKAADALRNQLDTHPRTPSGGLWHKKIYPNQMWLDGLYMGAAYFAQYEAELGNGENFDDIIHQFELIYVKTIDPETGLLYHAWDESKQMGWADKETGRSPNFWSRAMGWYMMALVDVLDYIPSDHEGRDILIQQLNELSEALAKVQDDSGLWYQVTNMAGREGNYLEASSSCMITYAWAKAVRKGYLPDKFEELTIKAYNGIINELIEVDKTGEVSIIKICKSAGLGGNPYRDGSYEYYLSEQIVTNNLHGTGPFILASIQVEKMGS